MDLDGHRILLLLGAGASYGHREAPGPDTPPLMKDFLVEAADSGVLNDKDFKQLTAIINSVALSSSQDLGEACQRLRNHGVSFEEVLSSTVRISNDLSELSEKARDERDPTRLSYYLKQASNAHFALDMSRFFIQLFVGRYCRTAIDDRSAYKKLAAFIRRNRGKIIGILTLNYDTICESALKSEGILYDYCLTRAKNKHLPFLKPHGSVNFRLPLARLVHMGPATDWQSYIRSENSFIEDLTIRGSRSQIEVYQPSYSAQDDFFGGQNRLLSHIPVLVQPLIDKKYDQLDSYSSIWDSLEKVLSNADTLAVVGCKIHPNETRLWDYLKKYLGRQTHIRIVGSNEAGLSEINGRFIKNGFKNLYPLYDVKGFHQYGMHYLSNDRL